MSRAIQTVWAVSRAAALTGLAFLVVLGPRVAQACSVCTAGRDEENQAAFLISTIGMSLLPLVALGTLLFVIRRRYQKLAEETANRTQPRPEA